ncbi:hypothetical protein KF707C_p480 (plasmid) [Metapseudomonas furukawaii]|uniref:Uncharacterized protein n=1 Tax=Metapseudomonas furukawaii TaxID=1149133 RepID=A0AAD1C6T5_METFU|nr:hypothetical protein KF707C_p480 [Pseudomonas furukawaii]
MMLFLAGLDVHKLNIPTADGAIFKTRVISGRRDDVLHRD